MTRLSKTSTKVPTSGSSELDRNFRKAVTPQHWPMRLTGWRWFMVKAAIWVQLNAKPGKERDLEEFLKSAQPLAEREKDTVSWYAVKMSPSSFGIFDTFIDDAGRKAHLNGEIAKALMAKAQELLANDPQIHQIEILAAKTAATSSRVGA